MRFITQIQAGRINLHFMLISKIACKLCNQYRASVIAGSIGRRKSRQDEWLIAERLNITI